MADPGIPPTVQRFAPRLVRYGEHQTHDEQHKDDQPAEPRESKQGCQQPASMRHAQCDVTPRGLCATQE
jgi:hypothetical protein